MKNQHAQPVEQKLIDYENNQLIRTQKIIKRLPEKNNLISVKDQSCLNFSSNDYLGLAHHPKIIQSFITSAQQYGFGSGSSNLVSGYTDLQNTLEKRFASWLGVEQTILFNSGYMANLGVITALSNRKSTLFSDRLCHASIIDGIILSKAKHYRYQHASIEHLKRLAYARKPDLILTESVFSMEGDLAPISDLIQISKTYQVTLMIDDAHGIGVLGKKGRGFCGSYHITQAPCPIAVIPLGKAFAGLGAIVAGSQKIIKTILQFARTYCYTTALPPALIAALHDALTIVMDEDWRREKLKQNIAFFNQQATEMNIPLTSLAQTPIRSIVVGQNDRVLNIQNTLLQKGFYVSAIRPPTVPEHTARIRLSLNALHTEKEIASLLTQIRKIIL